MLREAGEEELLFHRAQTLIREQLGRLRMSSLARMLHVDPRTLYNLFQRCAGCSAKEYQQRTVMEQARFLLTRTTRSMSRIAEDLGFSSQFHFSRSFHGFTGLTPSRYRLERSVPEQHLRECEQDAEADTGNDH